MFFTAFGRFEVLLEPLFAGFGERAINEVPLFAALGRAMLGDDPIFTYHAGPVFFVKSISPELFGKPFFAIAQHLNIFNAFCSQCLQYHIIYNT